VKGWVPAGKAAYGYKYRKEINPATGATIKAWWDINQADSDGNHLLRSEAWVVTQIFNWIGMEGKSTYWVAMELNKKGIEPRASEIWSPAKISFIVKRHCYTGKHAYNTASYVPNPDRPIKDITGQINRTIRRSKPIDEHVAFTVPALVAEWLWQKANNTINNRAQTKIKTKANVEALFRGRILCPRCGRRMTTHRDGRSSKLVYYICTSGSEPWNPKSCGASYIPLVWLDNMGWDNIAKLLKDPSLVLSQQKKAAQQDDELVRQVRLFDWQIKESNRRIASIQQDRENGNNIYTAEEASARVTGERQKIQSAEIEKNKIQAALKKLREDATHNDQMRQALEAIRNTTLSRATFEEKRKIIELLDAKIYPWEDRTGAQITCAFEMKQDSHYSTNIASPKE